MPTPQFEFKLNIVSLANLVALVGLLITAFSTYSSLVSNWTIMASEQAVFKSQILELQKANKASLDQIQALVSQDSDLRISMVNLQAQLSGRLAVVEVELRQLNTTVSKIEGAVQAGAGSMQPSTRRR